MKDATCLWRSCRCTTQESLWWGHNWLTASRCPPLGACQGTQAQATLPQAAPSQWPAWAGTRAGPSLPVADSWVSPDDAHLSCSQNSTAVCSFSSPSLHPPPSFLRGQTYTVAWRFTSPVPAPSHFILNRCFPNKSLVCIVLSWRVCLSETRTDIILSVKWKGNNIFCL